MFLKAIWHYIASTFSSLLSLILVLLFKLYLFSFNFSIGPNVQNLIDRKDGTYCFRLHKDRVFYMRFVVMFPSKWLRFVQYFLIVQSRSEKQMRLALAIPRKNLISCGVCVGRFSKRSSESSRCFRVHVTALDLIAPLAKVLIIEIILRLPVFMCWLSLMRRLLSNPLVCVQHKVWLRPSAEQQFLYGQHALKSGLARMSDTAPRLGGVCVCNQNDLPLVCICALHLEYYVHNINIVWSEALWGLQSHDDRPLLCMHIFDANRQWQGFGVCARSALELRAADPLAVAVFNQADIGEYLRHEQTLF